MKSKYKKLDRLQKDSKAKMSEGTVEKLQELYKSGRYECDQWFYEKLIDLVKSMEMYECIPLLESNFSHVKRIHKLIEENSDSLNEDFD